MRIASNYSFLFFLLIRLSQSYQLRYLNGTLYLSKSSDIADSMYILYICSVCLRVIDDYFTGSIHNTVLCHAEETVSFVEMFAFNRVCSDSWCLWDPMYEYVAILLLHN